jgi:hypothetical protein
MGEFELGCSIEHHFRGRTTPLTDIEYEENEKQRLLKFSKYERSLWCWICGFMLDPCESPTPKEGVEIFEQHRKECEKGWREEGDGEKNSTRLMQVSSDENIYGILFKDNAGTD